MTQVEKDVQMSTLYAEMQDLEAKLVGSDYKVAKCAEAMLIGQSDMPYDVVELHAERQAWRDRINEIEDAMKVLDALSDEGIFPYEHELQQI